MMPGIFSTYTLLHNTQTHERLSLPSGPVGKPHNRYTPSPGSKEMSYCIFKNNSLFTESDSHNTSNHADLEER